jgi:hypothetical protein
MSIPYENGDPVGNLLLYLNSKIDLSPDFQPSILPMLEPRLLKKKWPLAKPGDTLRTAVWLDDAYGCSYKIHFDKNDLPLKQIIDFFPPKSILLDALGFFSNESTDCHFEIVKNATIVPFGRTDFEQLKLSAPEAEALANRILAEMLKLRTAKAELKDLHGLARYQRFKEIYGKGILQAYPQKYIALFLGFTPEYLNALIGREERS